MKYILYALLAWFLYQFIFKLLIPVYKTSRKLKKGFREMQEKMASHVEQNEPFNPSNNAQNTKTPPIKSSPKDDYIDFEEVRKNENGI